MVSDSRLEFENDRDSDSLRVEQLQLEAKAARLEAEAKALQAKIEARKQAAREVLAKRGSNGSVRPKPEPQQEVAAPQAKSTQPEPPRKQETAKQETAKKNAAKTNAAKQAPAKPAKPKESPPLPAPSAKSKPKQEQPKKEQPKKEPPARKPVAEQRPKASAAAVAATASTAPKSAAASPTSTAAASEPKKVAPQEVADLPLPSPEQPSQSAAAIKEPTKASVASPEKPKSEPTHDIPSDLGANDTAESADPATDGEEEAAEPTGRGFVSRLLSTTPSYLISAVFHLVTLIVLALIMLPSPQDMVKQLVVSASTLEEEEEIEELIIETPDTELEPVELEEPVETQAFEVSDPGTADLGAVAQDIQAEVSTFGVAMNDTNIDSIGALFGSEGEGMTATLDGAGGAEFFGVKASGRKFVFVVDSSKSMNKGKFEAACEELMYSISRLSKDQYFYVLFFDHDAAKMTFDGNSEPEKRAVPATSANINKVGRWVRTVELELQTNPFDCIEFALTLNPDAIYILTDGKFTDRGRTVKYLKKENLYQDPFEEGTKPKSIIHTVGFYQRDGEETLVPLAKAHGGTYRFVPPPPKKK